MKQNDVRSYTAAGTLPWKLLQLKEQAVTADRRIVPIHIQLIPTNRCNGSCPWCSCSEVDRSIEMPFFEIENIAAFFALRGSRAVTITGGGEPTLHPKFYDILLTFKSHAISVGLVSNGIKWGKGTIPRADLISGIADWIRISTMDTTKNGDQPLWLDNIAAQLHTFLGVSFTVAENVDVDLAKRICEVANRYDRITHIRFVEDILSPDDALMAKVESECKPLTEKGIYQYRSNFTIGTNPCLISRLKPIVDPTGQVFPCCIEANEPVRVERDGKLLNLPIKDVCVGDICPSDTESGKITATYAKKASEMLRITVKTGRTILVSPDHTMLRATVQLKKFQRMRFDDYAVDSYELDEVSASNLSVDELLPVQMRAENYESDSLSEDAAFFAGAYVAEGWTSCGGVTLMFGKVGDKLLPEFTETAKRLGVEFKTYTRATGAQVDIHMKTVSDDLRALIADCGSRALNKRIPGRIQNASSDAKLAFLRAYFLGDGYFLTPRKNYPGYRLTACTISRELTSDLILLLQQLGVSPTVSFERREGEQQIEGRTVHVNDRYAIKISGKYNLELLESIVGELPEQSRSQRRAISFPHTTSVMFVPISRIERITGEFDVCDIQVEGTNKFFAGVGGVLVHNCGVQYANEKIGLRKMAKPFAMGHWSEYDEMNPFDGSICQKCYYGDYNKVLGGLTQPLQHIYHV